MTREEAIRRIKAWNLDSDDREVLAVIIPELRESEDERIRQALIEGVRQIRCKNGITQEQMLAWLEKQKEQKPLKVGENAYFDPNTERWFIKKEQKPIRWIDLTWKDIVELEGIINNVHYDFSAGIGQESFGKEVLERFRSTKGIEYLDEAEQKCWREEEQKEQKPTLVEKLRSVSTPADENWFEIQKRWEKEDEQQSAEWNEEDENMAYFVNQFLEYHENADPTAKSCKKWFNNRFKSLCPQIKQERQIKKGDKVSIHCRKDREE